MLHLRSAIDITSMWNVSVCAFAIMLMTSSVEAIQSGAATVDQALPAYVVAPSYPPLAYRARITGTVVLELDIDLSGKVQAARIVEGHPLLAGMSQKTGSLWLFAAADFTKAARRVQVWMVYKIVQGDSEAEETTSTFFPPNRIEITKQLPKIVSYVPSGLGELTEVRCKLHRETMQEDTVPITYGLIISEDVYCRAREEEFPNSNLGVSGGCVVESARLAKVLYCPKCRAAEVRWNRRHSRNSPSPATKVSTP